MLLKYQVLTVIIQIRIDLIRFGFGKVEVSRIVPCSGMTGLAQTRVVLYSRTLNVNSLRTYCTIIHYLQQLTSATY